MIHWQYSFMDFHSQGIDILALISLVFSFVGFLLPLLISFSPCPRSPQPCLPLPPWAFTVIQFPSHWWYSSLPKCQMFLDRNKLHFFMAYGKLPWLLLLLYPLCELNMYSVACCLRCYCWVTYGTDSIRMRLALDNPSDYMHPDRLLLGLPSVHPLAPVSAGCRFSLLVIIPTTRDAGGGWEGGRRARGKRARHTDRCKKVAGGGMERTPSLHWELTFKIILFGSGGQAYCEKRPERSL